MYTIAGNAEMYQGLQRKSPALMGKAMVKAYYYLLPFSNKG